VPADVPLVLGVAVCLAREARENAAMSLRRVFGQNEETPKVARCGGCGRVVQINPKETSRVVWSDSHPEPIVEYCHNACLSSVIDEGTARP